MRDGSWNPELKIIRDDRKLPPDQMVAEDDKLLTAAAGGSHQPLLRLWRNSPCIVVPKSDQREAGFERASEALSSRGWPIVARTSGGSAVVHDAGTLLISLIYRSPPDDALSIERSYLTFCDPILQTLSKLGLDASLGSVPGAMCDGRFNILVAGRKVAGTAQRWRRSTNPQSGHAILVHATLSLTDAYVAALPIVEQYYGLLGKPRTLRREAHTALTSDMPDGTALKTVKLSFDALCRDLEEQFLASREPLSVCHPNQMTNGLRSYSTDAL